MLQNVQRDQELFESYEQIIQKQPTEGVVEKVSYKANCNLQELYLPQKAVICENAESNKLWNVYHLSARGNGRSLSINGFWVIGLTLQKIQWNTLIRTRFKPICGDVQKAFLQIRINKKDRNA